MPKEREKLKEQVTEENRIRNAIVEAIQAHEPGLRDTPTKEIRQALDRWLAQEIFGGD